MLMLILKFGSLRGKIAEVFLTLKCQKFIFCSSSIEREQLWQCSRAAGNITLNFLNFNQADTCSIFLWISKNKSKKKVCSKAWNTFEFVSDLARARIGAPALSGWWKGAMFQPHHTHQPVKWDRGQKLVIPSQSCSVMMNNFTTKDLLHQEITQLELTI